jgi:subtilase family serine protease
VQLQVAYNLKPLYAKGLNGKGVTVVVLADGGASSLQSDLDGFDSAFHLPSPRLRVVFMDGSNATSGGSDELALDTEAVHTVAPGAGIVVLVVPSAPNPSSIAPQAKAVRYAAARHLGQVITTSMGNIGEAALGSATISDLHKSFQFAAGQRVSVVEASGDFGTSSRQTLTATPLDTRPRRGHWR